MYIYIYTNIHEDCYFDVFSPEVHSLAFFFLRCTRGMNQVIYTSFAVQDSRITDSSAENDVHNHRFKIFFLKHCKWELRAHDMYIYTYMCTCIYFFLRREVWVRNIHIYVCVYKDVAEME